MLRDLDERLKYLQNLAEKKSDIEKKIREQEKWTPELAKAVDEAMTMQTLEDLYAPYRPKKRTRAVIAREKGLEPLSKIILEEFLSTEELENKVMVNVGENLIYTITVTNKGSSVANGVVATQIGRASCRERV